MHLHPVLQLAAADFKLTPVSSELLGHLQGQEWQHTIGCLLDDSLIAAVKDGPILQGWRQPALHSLSRSQPIAEGKEATSGQHPAIDHSLLAADFHMSPICPTAAAGASPTPTSQQQQQQQHDVSWRTVCNAEAAARPHGTHRRSWLTRNSSSSSRKLMCVAPAPAGGWSPGPKQEGPGQQAPVESYAYASSDEGQDYGPADTSSISSSYSGVSLLDDEGASSAAGGQGTGCLAGWGCLARPLLTCKWLLWDMMPPSCTFRVLWDLAMLLLLVYVGLVTPYVVAFSVPNLHLDRWEKMVDSLFLADVVFNFRTGYLDHHHRLVMGRGAVAAHYAKGWFALDLAAALPWDSLLGTDGDMEVMQLIKSARLTRLLRMTRLLRLMRLARLERLLHLLRLSGLLRRQHLHMGSPALGLLLFGVMAGLLVHVVACGWAFIASLWSEDASGTWIAAQGLQGAGDAQVYVTALYWTLSTLSTVGYGDVSAHNPLEMSYSVGAILVGVSVFAYFMAHLAVLIASLTAGSSATTLKLAAVHELLRSRSVPPALAQRVHGFFAFATRRHLDAASRALLAELSAPLRTELLLYLHRDAVERVPFFAGQDPLFIADVVATMQVLHFAPGDLVFRQGDPGDTMYFVAAGRLEVLHSAPAQLPTDASSSSQGGSGAGAAQLKGGAPKYSAAVGPAPHPHHAARRSSSTAGQRVSHSTPLGWVTRRVGELTSGEHFGEYSVLLAQARTATVVALDCCELYSLSRQDLAAVAAKWPELAARFDELGLGLARTFAEGSGGGAGEGEGEQGAGQPQPPAGYSSTQVSSPQDPPAAAAAAAASTQQQAGGHQPAAAAAVRSSYDPAHPAARPASALRQPSGRSGDSGAAADPAPPLPAAAGAGRAGAGSPAGDRGHRPRQQVCWQDSDQPAAATQQQQHQHQVGDGEAGQAAPGPGGTGQEAAAAAADPPLPAA